jgi:hypothetical protein
VSTPIWQIWSNSLQVTFLNVGQSFPGIEPFADEKVEILLKAKALEMGREIAHSSGRSISLIQGGFSPPNLAPLSKGTLQPGR